MTKPVYITASASFLPNAPVSNDQMEQVLGMIEGTPSRARAIVLRNNGIRQRYYAIDPATGWPSHSNARLTAEAIRGLGARGFALEQLQVLCCGTSSPDQLAPSHAVMVHGELGHAPCELNSSAGICTAGMAALKYAWLSVTSGNSQNAVATGSEQVSSYMHARNFNTESAHRVEELQLRPEIAFEKDFLRWMLSDGAGALLLQDQPNQLGPSLRIDWIELVSHAHRAEACMYGGAEKGEDGKLVGWREFPPQEWLKRSLLTVKQDVKLLNERIVELTVEQTLPPIIARRGLQASDYDWFLPHMSSEYFRPRLAAGLKNCDFAIPPERWFTNLSEKGNTGSAAIYIMLDELINSGQLQTGQRLLCFVPESGRFSSSFMQLTVVG